MSDFLFVDHGSVTILTPVSERAQEWVADHLPDAMSFGGGTVIEPRYVGPILEGIDEDGLMVEF